jgi:septum formation protein
MRLVLASSSPRRAAILRAAGYDFDVRPSGAEEWPYPGGDPSGYTESLARAKAGGGSDGEVVVGADTVVVVDGAVLGKPADAEDAAAMLRRLSGRTHEVVTGVAVRHNGAVRSGHARTRLTLRVLDEGAIRAYVDTGEPLDKAGAYGYQGGAARFVTRLEGDADTVIGLPMALLRELLPPELRRDRGPSPLAGELGPPGPGGGF